MNLSSQHIAMFVALSSVGILSIQLPILNGLSTGMCQCLANSSNCFIVTSCKDSPNIKSELQSLNMPITHDETTRCGRSHHISQHPKYRELHRMFYHNILECLGEVMLFWQRYHGVIIADTLSGIDENAKKYLKTRGIDMEIVSGDNMEETESILQQPNYENFIVICDARNTKKILKAVSKMANESALFEGVQTWIIVAHQMPRIFNTIKIAPQTFVTLFIPTRNSYELSRNYLSWVHKTITNDAPSLQPWQAQYINCDKIATDKGISVVLSSKSKIALEYSSASRVNMFDVFYGHENEKTEAIQFGTWHEHEGMFMFEVLNPEDRAQRLRGRMTRAVTFEHKPYTFVTTTNGKLHVGGYSKELMDIVLDTLNIRYTVREIPQVFGIGINGTFTGMVGVLNRKESEITTNVVAMTNSRRAGIRYAGPVTKGHMGICYNRLEAIMPPTAYLLPFQTPVWILIISTAIVIGVLIIIVMIKSPGSYWTSTPSKAVHSTKYRVITGTVLEEALEHPPGIPSKLIFGTLLLTTMLVFIHYTSVFTSFLTSLDVPVPFKNLEDVIKNKEYGVIYLQNTRHHDAFRYAEDGLFAEFWQKLISDKKTIGIQGGNFEDGLKLMYTGKYAYLTEGPTTYYLAAHNCNVAFASKKYLPEFFYSTTRLDFPYSRILAMSLMRAMEGGLLQRLGEVYKVNRKPICKVENASSSLGLNQVAAVFIVWFCGVALALLAFCCEKTVFKKHSENANEMKRFHH